jgi:hypothetical protein
VILELFLGYLALKALSQTRRQPEIRLPREGTITIWLQLIEHRPEGEPIVANRQPESLPVNVVRLRR